MLTVCVNFARQLSLVFNQFTHLIIISRRISSSLLSDSMCNFMNFLILKTGNLACRFIQQYSTNRIVNLLARFSRNFIYLFLSSIGNRVLCARINSSIIFLAAALE